MLIIALFLFLESLGELGPYRIQNFKRARTRWCKFRVCVFNCFLLQGQNWHSLVANAIKNEHFRAGRQLAAHNFLIIKDNHNTTFAFKSLDSEIIWIC